MPAGGAEGNRAVATWAWVAAKGERLPHSLHVVAVQHVGECDDGRVPVARERAHARVESGLVGARLATSCVQVQRVHIQRCVVPGGGGEERSVLSPQRGCFSSHPRMLPARRTSTITANATPVETLLLRARKAGSLEEG